ncbi:hypothetical protein [Tenacibaculum sp. nBUS_03]|uniref:hypothetical protein n=1 Tax=Tenacibaculum sp. nBUS_03 TaxID=3395320 RepID=UPI003EBF03BE
MDNFTKIKQTNIIQRKYNLVDNSENNNASMANYNLALQAMDNAFRQKKIDYKLQGSMAQAMHGSIVSQLPEDFDILVTSPKNSHDELVNSGEFSSILKGIVVAKVEHKETKVLIDLQQIEDFGMQGAKNELINGISVLNLYEVLKSLLLRPSKRPKDEIAFNSLTVQRENDLTTEEKEDLAKTAQAPNWEQFKIFLDEQYLIKKLKTYLK